ncbi:hypothetical protein [Coprobacter sp.]
MRKFVFVSIASLLLLFGACTKKENRAAEQYQKAEELYQRGDYALAKNAIDSISTIDPRAFDEIRAGMQLMRRVNLSINKRNLAYVDSLLPIRLAFQKELLSKFALQKDEKYQENGNFVYKKDRNAGSVNRSCLRIQVTEDGQMQLMSVYFGASKLNHESVKVELPDGTFALTSVVPYDGANNYRFVNAGNTTEVVTYKGKQMRSVADLVYNSKDARIKVSYEGKRPFSFVMDKNTKEAISASYELALVMADIKQLQREKAIAGKTIEILERQIADHEQDTIGEKL